LAVSSPAARRARPAAHDFAVDETPPLSSILMLGVQLAVVSVIYLVVVAIVVRAAKLPEEPAAQVMSLACIATGVGALLHTLRRGPIGSGYLAIPAYSTTHLAPCVVAAQVGGMPLVFGMTIVAGLTEMVFALFISRMRILMTPVISGLCLFIVGLQVGLVGIGEFLDVPHESLSVFPLHLAVTVITLGVCVGLSIWGRGSLKILCSFLGLMVGTVAAIAIGLFGEAQWTQLGRAAWLILPKPAALGFAFDISLLPAFMAAGFCVSMRVLALLTTCQRMNDDAWERPDIDNLRKGVLADGLANVASGLIGGTGMTPPPSMIGIQSAVGITSRVVVYPVAAILIAMGFVPKLALFFMLIPQEVTGSVLVFIACFTISGGMEIMLSGARGPRANYVIGISSLLALSESAYPKYFAQLSPALRNFIGNPLAFGMAAAIALSLAFRLGTRQRDALAWSAPTAPTAVIAFLQATAQRWSVPQKTIDAATEEIGHVIGHLAGLGQLDGGGELRLSTDGLDFKAEIHCHGALLQPTPRESAPALPRYVIASEEGVVLAGLRTFLDSLAAERKQLTQRSGQTRVRLSYRI
jgi:NCS2 family nucleobase:cation symporter-2